MILFEHLLHPQNELKGCFVLHVSINQHERILNYQGEDPHDFTNFHEAFHFRHTVEQVGPITCAEKQDQRQKRIEFAVLVEVTKVQVLAHHP